MANLKLINRRIRTAKNIAKITQAMEMVAASKMRRAQERTLNARPYADKLDSILTTLQGRVDPQAHDLLQSPSRGQIAVIIVSTDRGLCGPHNTNLFRYLEQRLPEIIGPDSPPPVFITIGKKGSSYVIKTRRQLQAEFSGFPDRFSYEDTLAISEIALTGFRQGEFSQVWLAYMRFVNTLSQQPTLTRLLPIGELFAPPDKPIPASPEAMYLFEPSTAAILDWLLPYYVELQIYQSLLNALASEHSARMVTMRSAHDNATDIVDTLTLDYNRARQTRITSELLDVITARTALGE